MREPRCEVCDGLLYRGNVAFNHDQCQLILRNRQLPYVCTQCSGRGKVATRFEERKGCCRGGPAQMGSFGAFAGCEWCPNLQTYQVATEEKTCDLCTGEGRLAKAPVPVQETKVIGWKRG